MGVPGSSPRWRAFEAKIPRPALAVVRRPPPDKMALCERFCAKRHIFVEVKLALTCRRLAEFRRWTRVDPPRIYARDIIKAVADKHGFTVNDLLCFSRRRSIVYARQEAAYEITRLTTLSYPQIGHELGGREHTTILHANRAHAKRTGEPLLRGLTPERKR